MEVDFAIMTGSRKQECSTKAKPTMANDLPKKKRIIFTITTYA